MTNYDWPFGTLPFGLFGSNLDTKDPGCMGLYTLHGLGVTYAELSDKVAITIGHLGHFLLDFLAQIWTQRTLRHILGPILVIFEICQFLTIPGPFEYFSENGWSQKIKVFSMKERSLPPLSV